LDKKIKRLVVKVGTSSVTRDGGHLDLKRISRFVQELATLRKKGIDILLVSSGAIAAGVGELGWTHKPHAMGQKQAAAAVGQPRLMETYRQLFRKRGVRVAQLLLTREDFENRSRAQNAEATLSALLQSKVIPIINENDSVAVEEIRFGDNDTLAALVAVKVKADLLVLLTDVEGLMTHPPHHRKGELIAQVDHIGPHIEALAHSTPGTEGGTGGMLTKVRAAKTVTRHGVDMIIASGRRPGVLSGLINGKPAGTLFSKNK
jgi:glutamate 5-kinase